jgi:hypothetical protein
MSMTLWCNKYSFMLLFEHCVMMFIYVIAVYVSSDPGTYIVRIRFAFQNRVWHSVPRLTCPSRPLAPATSPRPASAAQEQPPWPAPLPSSSVRSKPSDSFLVRPWDLLKLDPWTRVTGIAQSCSPEFKDPPAHVDRVSPCTVFKFLARMASVSPRDAPRAP